MSIGILATGDEIVCGDTLNTNTHHIAHILHSEGLILDRHLACGDKNNDIIESIQFLAKYCATIIIIGGLGPTSDDKTRFSFSEYLKTKLIEFPEALSHIESRLKRGHLKLNNGNRQQALFPENAKLLPNPHGTAMGCYCANNDKQFFLLPGPPRECLPMFMEYVIPLVQKNQHYDTTLLKWRLFGVSEGQIAELLDKSLSSFNCVIGYRLEMPYLEFKVRCFPQDIKKIEAIIDPLVKPYIIASPLQKASEKLQDQINKLQAKIEILDDVSGGRVQQLLLSPATFPYLHFHENHKAEMHFHFTGLNDFWRQTDSSATELTIHYRSQGKKGSETHKIPYRSAYILDYAAEWLCFRLLHLIDQLH